MHALSFSHVRTHWFFLLAPLVIAVDIYVVLDARGEITRLIEAGVLFDLALLLPCLYWLCYRARGKRAVIRAVALACVGIWAALKLVPESEQSLLNYVAPLRYLGLAALAWIELAVILVLFRAIFNGRSREAAAATPPGRTNAARADQQPRPHRDARRNRKPDRCRSVPWVYAALRSWGRFANYRLRSPTRPLCPRFRPCT